VKKYINILRRGGNMKNRKAFILSLLFIGLCFFIWGLSPAGAQDPGTDEFTLEEITVTAQKRAENQQKVPIAMDVISGEDLVAAGKDNVDEILADVSNVFINTAADGMRIAMRGIADESGVMDDQHVGGSTVSVNIDGSYNNMNNAGQNLFDLERVEVLFGPQSTLYGSNAPGGIVNVVTASPKADRYEVSGSVEYGTYSLLNLQGMVNAPVIQDKVALRLAANRSELGSYVDSDEESNTTTTARLRALWNVYDRLTFILTTNWQKRSNGGMMGGSVKPFVDQDDKYYPDGTKLTDPWTSDTSTAVDPIFGAPNKNRDDQVTKGASANIDWSTKLGTISLIPSYSKSTSEGWQTRTSGGGGGPGGPPPMSFDSGVFSAQQAVSPQQTTTETQVLYQTRSNTQKGAELRMTNAEDFELFQWILGGTYYDSKQENTEDYEDPATLDTSRLTTQKKKALYGNITYPLWFNYNLRLTLGYRQSWDESHSFSVATFMGGSSGNPKGYSKPDFKYGIEYDVNEDMMFFGSFSSSYRSGDAMSMPDAKGNFPEPEELDAYSVGAKSRWLDNKLQLNVSAFYYDYTNKLCSGFKEALAITERDLGGDYISIGDDGRGRYGAVQEPDGIYPTLDTFDLDKDGNTTEEVTFDLHDPNSQGTGDFNSYGLDLQANWIITGRDKLNFSISYLNAEWVDLNFHYYWYMYWPDENYKGVTPTNSPKWSMTANYEHNFMLGSFGTLTPRIQMQHKTEYSMIWNPADKDPLGYGTQEPFYLWDAYASFNHSSGKWSLNAYCKNITNYAVKRSYMGMMSFTMMIGEPRTYGVTLSVKF